MTVAQGEVYVANWSDAPKRIQKQPKCSFWTRSSKPQENAKFSVRPVSFWLQRNAVSVRAQFSLKTRYICSVEKLRAGKTVHNQISVAGNMECGSI